MTDSNITARLPNVTSGRQNRWPSLNPNGKLVIEKRTNGLSGLNCSHLARKSSEVPAHMPVEWVDIPIASREPAVDTCRSIDSTMESNRGCNDSGVQHCESSVSPLAIDSPGVKYHEGIVRAFIGEESNRWPVKSTLRK